MAIAPTNKREADAMALKLFCLLAFILVGLITAGFSRHYLSATSLLAKFVSVKTEAPTALSAPGALNAPGASWLEVRVTVVSAVHRRELERPPRITLDSTGRKAWLCPSRGTLWLARVTS